MLDGLLAAGLPREVASNYTEMGSAIRSGKLQEDFQLNRPSVSGKVKLEDFARQFKEAYEAWRFETEPGLQKKPSLLEAA